MQEDVQKRAQTAREKQLFALLGRARVAGGRLVLSESLIGDDGLLPEAVLKFNERVPPGEAWYELSAATSLLAVDCRLQSLRGVSNEPNKGLLVALTTLDVGDNELETMDAAIFEAPLLRSLSAPRNQLAPSLVVAPAPALAALNVASNTRLEALECDRAAALTTVDASSCALTCFVAPPHVAVLDVNRNRLPTLTLSGAMSRVDASFNRIESVDFAPGVAACTRLARLDLSNNALSEFAPPAASLPALLELHAARNRLGDAVLGVLAAAAPRLMTLNLASNRVEHVADALTTLTALARLDLSGNAIARPPLALGRMATQLKSLRLVANPLRSVRTTLVNADDSRPLLDYLASRVPVDEPAAVAPELATASKENVAPSTATSTTLSLTRRAPPLTLAALQAALSAHVVTLDVSFNQLTALPFALLADASPSLTHLDASNNRLEAVDDDVTRLTCLRTLNLANNELRDVNPRLGLCTQLSSLNLHGNPQRKISTFKLQKPTHDLLAYLRLKLPADTTD